MRSKRLLPGYKQKVDTRTTRARLGDGAYSMPILFVTYEPAIFVRALCQMGGYVS